MSLFEISTAAHLAGSLVLALFFVLLARHDPRPYLRGWTYAWIAQALALGVLLASSHRAGHATLTLYIALGTAHGLLLCAAATSYARDAGLRRDHLWAIAPLALWSVAGPALLPNPRAFNAAQSALLAAAYLAAAALLWRFREPGSMGLRLTTNVLALLALLYLLQGAVFAWTLRAEAGAAAWVEVTPFAVLLLQMLLALGMVLTVMEAGQRTLAATNAQLGDAQRRLKALADTDPLTGCFNRRVFRELVDEVRGGKGPREGVVLLLDMDGLKATNDREGHAAGDEAIRGMAAAIRSRTRGTDILVRWGGDEFVIVMPGVAAAEAAARRDAIAAALAEAGLSASAGSASYDAAVDIMAAVDTADRRMYEAKAEGKRRDGIT